jgi:hypothetical protein
VHIVKAEDAQRNVGILGERLVRETTARRDLTALLISVADLTDWNVASDLAGLLGLDGDQQEAIHKSWTKDKE